jgi:hypothetical protein
MKSADGQDLPPRVGPVDPCDPSDDDAAIEEPAFVFSRTILDLDPSALNEKWSAEHAFGLKQLLGLVRPGGPKRSPTRRLATRAGAAGLPVDLNRV